jgi:hypothetical protein
MTNETVREWRDRKKLEHTGRWPIAFAREIPQYWPYAVLTFSNEDCMKLGLSCIKYYYYDHPETIGTLCMLTHKKLKEALGGSDKDFVISYKQGKTCSFVIGFTDITIAIQAILSFDASIASEFSLHKPEEK